MASCPLCHKKIIISVNGQWWNYIYHNVWYILWCIPVFIVIVICIVIVIHFHCHTLKMSQLVYKENELYQLRVSFKCFDSHGLSNAHTQSWYGISFFIGTFNGFFFGMYILWIGMAFLKAKCISCGKFAVDNNEYSDRWSIKNRQLSAILHF